MGIRCHVRCHCLTWCLAARNRAQIERQCRGEKGISRFRGVPPSLPSLQTRRKQPAASASRFKASRAVRSRALGVSSTSSLGRSVGCWRAFCETEGLGCGVGREPSILMIFSGCITISRDVPSVHQGHAIQRRERATGPHQLPLPPCFLEALKGRRRRPPR